MSAADPTPTEPVRLLTVCTGNICRSPYAAVLLQHGLAWARPGAFEVTSAGTHALVGRPMDPGSRALLDAKGIPVTTAPARLLVSSSVAQQAMVLVMSERHREVVLDECPSVHRRTLGVLDLARALVAVSGTYHWPELLADAGAKEVRGRWRVLPEMLLAVGAMPGKVTEVDDPYGRGSDAFGRMARTLDEAVRTIVYWEAQFAR
ncbi:arsenate reductase/protein-tyrosine-phosphatase family protein [Phycicoccus flavus]|uniref:arsenate reductase/protein-tyrosine-phosphatase family protein n=1 Tax=Phycicoccus flavus TaxID=2502783 RepID=UPI000FEBE05A|nr:hypothetical protein [Phycicoccus flavus]NHA66873.1 hypothetical protein [Phycicoccus flavus]